MTKTRTSKAGQLQLRWEAIEEAGGNGRQTERARIFGGWLVRCDNGAGAIALTYVPDRLALWDAHFDPEEEKQAIDATLAMMDALDEEDEPIHVGHDDGFDADGFLDGEIDEEDALFLQYYNKIRKQKGH